MFFKNTDEIKNLIPISNAVEFERLKPHINQIENEFIIPLMGNELYDVFIDYYNENNTDNLKVNVITATQNSIIHLVYWRGFDVLNAYISDGGFKRSESDKVKSLFKYQEDNLREYFKTIGFNALDTMLEKLEIYAKNASENSVNENWYKAYHDDFINNAREFSEIYEINGSRLIFLRLKKYMKQIKDLELKKVLGQANWEYILSEIVKTTTAEKVKQILPCIQIPLAFLSVALLMEDTGADLSDKGLVYDGKVSQNGVDAIKIPSEENRVNRLIKRNRDIGNAYLLELKNYLIDHAADWGNYSAPKSGLHQRDNSGRKTFWV